MVMAGHSDGTTIMLDAVNVDMSPKPGTLLASLLFRNIEAVGAERVVQVCKDIATSIDITSRQRVVKYPRIHITRCGAHCSCLLIKKDV